MVTVGLLMLLLWDGAGVANLRLRSRMQLFQDTCVAPNAEQNTFISIQNK